MKRFGEYVREARLARGWTMQRLAWEIRGQKGYVCQIEKGTVPPPSPRIVEKLCRKLGLPTAEMQAKAYLEKRPAEVDLGMLLGACQKAQESELEGTAVSA